MRTCLLSDTELIVSYSNGDDSAFNQLLNRHKSKVYAYIISMTQDKIIADDIYQETLFKVVNKINMGSYKDDGRFINWVMRIAHNQVIDHYRKANRFSGVSDYFGNDIFDTIPNNESAERLMIKEQTHCDIRQLIRLLPHDQRRVVIMRHYGNLDFKCIAEKTGVSINTAVGRMRYALLNLKKLADKHAVSFH